MAKHTDKPGVLLVDDRPENGLVLAAALESLGVNLRRATSGDEALALLAKDDYAVVLLPVQLPVTDGYEAARRIRASDGEKRVPIIFLTANADDAQLAESYALGAVDHVTGPFSPEILRAKVRTLVELKREALRTAGRSVDGHAATILESITDAFFALDREWRFTYVNRQAEEGYFRMERGQLLGRGLWELFPIGQGTQFEREFRRAVETGTAAHFEAYALLRQTWVEVHAYPSADGLSVYFRDITEQRRLQDAANRLAAIVESSEDAIIGKDLDGIVTSWNGAAERMFGYPAEEIIGKPITLIIPPDRQHEEAEILARLRSGERMDHFETVRRRKSGEPVYVSVTISPIRDRNGRVIGASRIVRDIGERRQAAAALAESERRFRYMCDHAPVLIWLAGTDALRYWFNRPWLEFTGRSLEEEQGYGWTEGVHPEDYDRCLEIYTASFDRREPFQLDYRLRRCDGQYRWMLATGAPLYGPGGETTGYAGSCIDITERKEIDLKKDNFLAMLGHELRNPIGSVANVVHLIRRRRGDPGTLPGYLDIVDRQVKYMSRLVGDIQDISRLRTGKLTLQKEIIPVQRLLRDALETVDGLIRSRGHQVEVRMPEVEIHLLADPDRMRQVISNLLSNAAKYTPAPGRIWVNLGSSDTEVTLTVRDDGIGIPAEALPTIFDLFEQVPRGVGESREGLGLGLTLVRGLVEMHDGAVTAASEGPGKGSEFTLRLPLAPCREAVPDD